MNEPLRAVDLCCGAGGWACAARGLPVRWGLVADWAGDCLETWQINHGAEHPDAVLMQLDVATKQSRKLIANTVREAGGVDLIVGAIPCEQLSIARANRPLKPGELEGIHDLIDSCFDLVKRLRPRWWCFEDVIQVEGHLPTSLHSGIPYECRRINAADYGPQNRVRTFFGRFPELAAPEPGPRTLASMLRPGPYRTLPGINGYERHKSKWYSSKRGRVQEPSRAGATVVCRSGTVPVENKLARVLDTSQPCQTVADFGSRHERAALISVRDVTIAANAAEDMIRVLEWQEAATLQGFPPDYVFAASWSRTWKMVAQAISVHVGRAILQGIVKEAGESK